MDNLTIRPHPAPSRGARARTAAATTRRFPGFDPTVDSAPVSGYSLAKVVRRDEGGPLNARDDRTVEPTAVRLIVFAASCLLFVSITDAQTSGNFSTIYNFLNEGERTEGVWSIEDRQLPLGGGSLS